MSTLNAEEVAADFRSRLQRALAVAAEPSPDAEPFKNHYAARDLLQALLTSSLSPLEVAIVQAKLGATHLHVEEPHNAQPALENAARFLAPELLAFAAGLEDDEQSAQRSKSDVDALLAALPHVRIDSEREAHAIDILARYEALALAPADDVPREDEENEENNDEEEDEEAALAALRDVRAHTNFYLAQVFGALNLPGASAQFCLATLELQLRALLLASSSSSAEDRDCDAAGATAAAADRLEAVQDWVKNCLRLVDYYLAADNWSDAAVGLSACERLLSGADAAAAETVQLQRAETQLNWAKLHHAALRAAQLRDEGFPTAAQPPLSPTAARMALTLASTALAENSNSSDRDARATEPAMRHVPAAAIASFDAARDVFKMGMRACDRAKRVFVLDGFVTQHVRVRQLESAFYKRLVHFERDRKRQVAMHLRRLALLTPVLDAELNAAAYCALLQEVSYECAEVAAEVFDLKRERKFSPGDDKANAYALKAVHWYQQYVLLFYPPSLPNSSSSEQHAPPFVKTGAAVRLPSSSVSAHEFRSLLLGYFGLARVCGRLQFATAHKDKTVLFWKQSLAYHEAVLELVRQFERAQAGVAGGAGADEAAALHELFDAELTISREMVELLPEKINQLVYNDKLL
ncbi:hypothetical protein PybrP1_010351 [[Pythium] brassicae (nom. inval.)]|nr:hypothetical protein PybrP1_010351 [[Pythium] brassicae (nom. inval.)]